MSGPRVLVITAMRDEAVNLLDWVAHTRAAGADEILVYSNDCTDGTETYLDLLHAAGAVTHVRNAVPEGRTPQWSALRQAADHPATEGADWIAVLDCDEYINLRAPLSRMQDLIGAVEADAIVLPWRLFGHNGHATRPDLPAGAAYTRAIPETALYPALSRFFKTLYRRAAFGAPGVHRPKKASVAAIWVDGSGNPLPSGFDDGQIMLWGEKLANEKVQLNHYSIRSGEDFLAKVARGLPNHTEKPVDLSYWVERNFNTVLDDSIACMSAATEAELARLMTLPGIAEAEARARSDARMRFQTALRDPELVKLYGRLLLSAGSTPPDDRTARTLVRLFQAART